MLHRSAVSRRAPLWLTATLFVSACSSSGSADNPDGGTGPDGGMLGTTCTDCTPTGAMTFALPSPTGAKLWTTPTMEKVLREATPPTATGDGITIFAAQNEYEPFQLVVRPDAAGSAKLTISDFTGPGTIAKSNVELRRVGYVHASAPSDASSIMSPSGYLPDPLEPVAFGTADAVSAMQNQPYWITVYVPPGTPAGDYTATLTVTAGSGTQNVPVKLHVYGFALPSAISFDGNWNASFQRKTAKN